MPVKRVRAPVRGIPRERCLLGVDVGATNVRAGLVTLPGGAVHAERTGLIEAVRGKRFSLDRLAHVVDETVAHGRVLGLKASAVGIGLPELVGIAGTIDSHCSLPWRTDEVRSRLSKYGPVTIASDVRAAALAEARLGAGRGVSSFLFICVGTGISSTLVVNGMPYSGAHGHAIAFASGPTCATRVAGKQIGYQALEARASGPAVLRRARQGGASDTNTVSVCRAAQAGAGPEREAVDAAASELGVHVALLTNALDPALIVLGGGLGSEPGRFWMSFRGSMRRHLWGPNARRLPIKRARLGWRAGLVGAALSADEATAG